MKSGDSFVPDNFAHEQKLIINEKGKTLLIAGCAYRGIVNIMISSILRGPDLRTAVSERTGRVIYTVCAPPGVSEDAVIAHPGDTSSVMLKRLPRERTRS